MKKNITFNSKQHTMDSVFMLKFQHHILYVSAIFVQR